MLRVEPLEALRLQRPDNVVVVAERIPEHGVRVLDRGWRFRGPILPDVFVREQVDVLRRWQRQRADLDRVRVGHREPGKNRLGGLKMQFIGDFCDTNALEIFFSSAGKLYF